MVVVQLAPKERRHTRGGERVAVWVLVFYGLLLHRRFGVAQHQPHRKTPTLNRPSESVVVQWCVEELDHVFYLFCGVVYFRRDESRSVVPRRERYGRDGREVSGDSELVTSQNAVPKEVQI